ncbi:hypothetical protein cypCar_00048129, partial [Cyprinus carpio]
MLSSAPRARGFIHESKPRPEEKSSDEMKYAAVVTDCVSQMGFLMRIPLPEVRRQICSSVIAFYSRDKHRHSSDACLLARLELRALMLERRGVSETLVIVSWLYGGAAFSKTVSLQTPADPVQNMQESGSPQASHALLTFPELKSHNPLVRNLKLSFNQEDFEMKKLLLNIMVVLSRDLAALQLFREGRVMLALMLLVKPSPSAVCRWTSRQQEELQLQALSTLSTLAPLMLDEYISCQANTCLLLLDCCLQDDTFSGRGHGFHGSGGGRKAQLRGCMRVLRSVTSVEHEPLQQDLCDQGVIGQLLGESPVSSSASCST